MKLLNNPMHYVYILRMRIYRKFVCGKGSLNEGETAPPSSFEIGAIEKFKYRTRYFSDSGIIGTKVFCRQALSVFQASFYIKT